MPGHGRSMCRLLNQVDVQLLEHFSLPVQQQRSPLKLLQDREEAVRPVVAGKVRCHHARIGSRGPNVHTEVLLKAIDVHLEVLGCPKPAVRLNSSPLCVWILGVDVRYPKSIAKASASKRHVFQHEIVWHRWATDSSSVQMNRFLNNDTRIICGKPVPGHQPILPQHRGTTMPPLFTTDKQNRTRSWSSASHSVVHDDSLSVQGLKSLSNPVKRV
jgi:hypothetical protein